MLKIYADSMMTAARASHVTVVDAPRLRETDGSSTIKRIRHLVKRRKTIDPMSL